MKAIILARRDFRESDQIISFLTLEKGKLEVLARGVKKITSKNSAHLEPFSCVELEIIKGKELDYLGKVQGINYFISIRKDLQKSLTAGFVVDLLNKLLEVGEKDEKIFVLFKGWLEFVNNCPEMKPVLVDGFIVKLLFYLGLDIVSVEKTSVELKKDLTILLEGDWQLIFNLKFEKGEYERLHGLIYKFLIFQIGKKINDWDLFLKDK